MMTFRKLVRQIAAALSLTLAATGAAQAADTVGTSFPPGFLLPADTSLGTPMIGFGGEGPVARAPVIFLHGNDDTPYPTGCGRTGVRIDRMAQYFADNGYSAAELWALGYQGTQCDQVTFGWTQSASLAHTVTANVQDLRAFVAAVMAYTGIAKVDIVAHGMGVVLAREWVRQDSARKLVRKFVAIEGPNAGMILCANAAGNHWQLAFEGGYTPGSAVCQELGSPGTTFLKLLNAAKDGTRIIPADTLVIRNGDTSYLFMPWNDGLIGGVPAVDVYGVPTDFSLSASLRGGQEITLTGQGVYDLSAGTAHAGIANSPATWQAALAFLAKH